MINIAIAISTFFPKYNETRLGIFKDSITSLVKCGLTVPIFVVDDGSPDKTHLVWITSTPTINEKVTIVERAMNGGISKCKNTSIKCLLDGGFDFGILADDDVLYGPGFTDLFISQMQIERYPHISVQLDKTVGGCPANVHPRLVPITNVYGCFFTISRALVEKVGYFKVYPYQYGYEHQNYSERILKAGLIPKYLGLAVDTCPIALHPQSITNKSIDIDPVGVQLNLQSRTAERNNPQIYQSFAD